jgi:hypothetical protein
VKAVKNLHNEITNLNLWMLYYSIGEIFY